MSPDVPLTKRIHPFRGLKRFMPRRLFGRSLLIILVPIILLQGVVTLVFFDRHYRIVTATLTRGVANEIGYLVMLERRAASENARVQERQTAASILGYEIQFVPGDKLTRATLEPDSVLERQLLYVLSDQISPGTQFGTAYHADTVSVRVKVQDGVLQINVPRQRVSASNAALFIAWMIGSSLILVAVAILFMRNQVKPIEELARAAEDLGKGKPVNHFKPHGATEVRRAAQAFLQMRSRIERHVQQRTEMLAGVSHDLKTPLTRLRLQLAMMEKTADIDAMIADVVGMEHMINAYLDFARDESGERTQPTDVNQMIEEAIRDAATPNRKEQVEFALAERVVLPLKRATLKRCLTNLIDNALKYAGKVAITVRRGQRFLEIILDDDGPGIPKGRREDVFRPFYRLDEARNLDAGGVGLGLAVAQDAARAHGGVILLDDSPAGGLRAVLRLPL